jgi:hypothetical protein
MELVLIVTFAGIIGTIVRYVVPGRELHGLAVMPAAGVILGSLAWTISVWAGLEASSVWPWVISLGLATAGTIALAIELPKRRTSHDDALWAELTHARS